MKCYSVFVSVCRLEYWWSKYFSSIWSHVKYSHCRSRSTTNTTIRFRKCCFSIWEFRNRKTRLKERPQRKTRGERFWGSTKTNSVFNQCKCCPSSRFDLKALLYADWRGDLEKGTEEGAKWDRQNKSNAGKNDDICFLTDILDQYRVLDVFLEPNLEVSTALVPLTKSQWDFQLDVGLLQKKSFVANTRFW